MNDTFIIGQGQGHEVEQALARTDWTNALLKKACGGDFFAKVRLVLEGKAEIVMKAAEAAAETLVQKVTNLLQDVGETMLPATAEKKINDSFVGSRYYPGGRDSDLDRWLSTNQPAGKGGKISGYQLEQELNSKEVAQAILRVGETSIDDLAKKLIAGGHTVVPSQIEVLIERTDAGNNTGLLTNGYGNFFFVQDKGGSVSVVVVHRNDDRQWRTGVLRLGIEHRWRVGIRFFSRNN